jgi:very-short-patch-repair endonuclease
MARITEAQAIREANFSAGRFMHRMGGKLAPDHVIAAIAERQHGVIAVRQLAAVGISHRIVERRVATGRVHRKYRGVYAIGHPRLSNEGEWMAAVLACGKGAVLSHRSAAELWGMLPALSRPIDVTVPSRGGRGKQRGLRIHRPSSLAESVKTHRNGIAVTTPARTITDLKRVAAPAETRRAIRQAEFLGLPLGLRTDRTRSDLESDFLRLCRRHRIPDPEINVQIGPFTIDFYWPAYNLAVEPDGWRAHRGPQAFLDDREREAFLRLRGIDLIRLSDDQVANHPETVAALLRRRVD